MADDVKEIDENDGHGGLDVMATVATGMEEFNIGLLNAFKAGIEQSLRLVQQMSETEKSVAINTLASLCGQANLNVVERNRTSIPKTVEHEEISGEQIFSHADGEEEEKGMKSESPEKDFVAFVTEINNVSNEMMNENQSHQRDISPVGKKKKTSLGKAASTTSKATSILKVPTVQRRSQRRKRQLKRSIDGSKDISTNDMDDIEEQDMPPPVDGVENELPEDEMESKVNDDVKGKSFKCQTCPKSFGTKYALNVHKRTHTGEKPYSCHICDKSFSCSNNRQRHIRETHEGLRPFNCSLCAQGFYKSNKLEKHWVDVHSLSEDEVKQEKLKITKPKSTPREKFDCEVCGKEFKTRSNLKVHEAVHKEERQHKCPNCEKRFSFRTNLKRHMLLHTGVRPHRCDLCFKGFIEHKSLQLHMIKEHGAPDAKLLIALKGSEKISCRECGRELASRASLHNHMLTHTGSKPHVCPKCSRTFSMKSNLKRHLRTHSNEKPWVCTTCGKRFTEKKSLEIHFRVHTGERPYSCKVCGKAFAQAGTLQAHMPVHNKKPAIQCEHCGKSFLRMSHYKFHISKYTNPPRYKCSDCSKTFHRRADLTRHRLTHSGEKPFHCNLCPKQFSRRLYLKDHLNIHLGQRPYTCLYCPSTYAESSTRSKHMRRCPMRITSKTPSMPSNGVADGEELNSGIINQEAHTIQEIHCTQDIQGITSVDDVSGTVTLQSDVIMTDNIHTGIENVACIGANQQEVIAADNLVALANSGVVNVQSLPLESVVNLPINTLNDVGENIMLTQAVTDLDLPSVNIDCLKDLHVQSVDNAEGPTKHYFIVLHHAPATQ